MGNRVCVLFIWTWARVTLVYLFSAGLYIGENTNVFSRCILFSATIPTVYLAAPGAYKSPQTWERLRIIQLARNSERMLCSGKRSCVARFADWCHTDWPESAIFVCLDRYISICGTLHLRVYWESEHWKKTHHPVQLVELTTFRRMSLLAILINRWEPAKWLSRLSDKNIFFFITAHLS